MKTSFISRATLRYPTEYLQIANQGSLTDTQVLLGCNNRFDNDVPDGFIKVHGLETPDFSRGRKIRPRVLG